MYFIVLCNKPLSDSDLDEPSIILLHLCFFLKFMGNERVENKENYITAT